MRPPIARTTLALLQAGVYGGGAWVLSERSALAVVLLAGGGVAQLVAAGALLARRTRLVAAAAGATLVAAGVVWADLFLLARQIQAVFGPDPGQQGWSVLAGTLAAIPWLLAVPVHQLVTAGWGRVSASLLVAPLPGLLTSPLPVPDPPPATAAARAAWDAWGRGSPGAIPVEGDVVRLTRLEDGVAQGAPVPLTDASAVVALLSTPPGPESALLVDVCGARVPAGFARPGVDAPLDISPVLYVRSQRATVLVPGLRVPGAPGGAVRCASAVASEQGAVGLSAGWTQGPVLSPAALDDAVRAGAAHLVHNQRPNGRFTYLVKGPSGADGGGYNYPRHAGTAWFLARASSALDLPEAGAAADRALVDLVSRSRTLADGRRTILDPARKDGRTWIGTTSLAVLAQLSRGLDGPGARERLLPWAAQVVASVDATGMVRSEMLLADGTFPDQVANAYGQGQAMLALSALVRAAPEPALTEAAREALTRALAFVDHGYYGTPTPLWVPDEHWMCLAAHGGAEALGQRSAGADGVCRTYLGQMRLEAPQDSALVLPAGPAGGGAEAVIARAWDTRDPATLSLARRFGQLLLDNQYRPADAPLLGDASALIGGFRDGPGDLDVQIDAVQHIGSALLGLEALLSDRARPGSLP